MLFVTNSSLNTSRSATVHLSVFQVSFSKGTQCVLIYFAFQVSFFHVNC